MTVDFPAPLAPISPTVSPFSIAKETSESTGFPFSYANVTLSNWIISHLSTDVPSSCVRLTQRAAMNSAHQDTAYRTSPIELLPPCA